MISDYSVLQLLSSPFFAIFRGALSKLSVQQAGFNVQKKTLLKQLPAGTQLYTWRTQLCIRKTQLYEWRSQLCKPENDFTYRKHNFANRKATLKFGYPTSPSVKQLYT
jgi:hypothetical protein